MRGTTMTNKLSRHDKTKCRSPHLYILLTLNLVCPSAFLFFYLVFKTVVNVNNTICANR